MSDALAERLRAWLRVASLEAVLDALRLVTRETARRGRMMGYRTAWEDDDD